MECKLIEKNGEHACFDCPYPDCILRDEKPYKKMSSEEFKAHRKEYQRQYHLKRKAERNAAHLANYYKNREEINAKRKAKRLQGAINEMRTMPT